MRENIEKIEKNIKIEENLKEVTFDINIIENSNSKFMDLINNINDFEYELKNKYYNFKFIEPIYIKSVRFLTVEGIDLKGLEIVYIDVNDEENSIEFSKGNNTWLPNKVIKSFKMKAPLKFMNKIRLSKIELLGFKLEEFPEISEKVKKLDTYKGELENFSNEIKERINELDNKEVETTNKIANLENVHKIKINELKKEIEECEILLKNLEEQRLNYEEKLIPSLLEKEKNIKESLETIEIKGKSIRDENTTLSNNVKQLTDTSNTLNSKISHQKDELQKLTEDTNLFATEIGSYTKQGNKDISLYTKLSLIPWIVIVVVSGIVFWGTSELTTIYSLVQSGAEENIDIDTIFWSRLPFALIVISILFVSYEISKMFIQNIIHIQKQKRIFMKIGIIAKDVADQSILGLELDEREKFELRTKLKMDLLKSHLKNEIGEEYEDKVNTSLLDYYNEYKKNRDAKYKNKELSKKSESKEVNKEE